jgi:hypothetical protein
METVCPSRNDRTRLLDIMLPAFWPVAGIHTQCTFGGVQRQQVGHPLDRLYLWLFSRTRWVLTPSPSPLLRYCPDSCSTLITLTSSRNLALRDTNNPYCHQKLIDCPGSCPKTTCMTLQKSSGHYQVTRKRVSSSWVSTSYPSSTTSTGMSLPRFVSS